MGIEHYSSWQDIVDNIDELVEEYDIGGIKEKIGQRSHASVINALKRFKEFIIINK